MGWEPAEVTTFEYDDDGRCVEMVTVREPEFSAWDLSVLLAERADSLRPRGRHGILLSEAADPENVDAYKVGLPTTDFAQQALDRAQERYRKAWPDAEMGSLLWHVETGG